MGEISEFPLHIRVFLRAYRWRRIDPVPWARLSKPLAECRVGLVSSAGFVHPDDDPFDESVPGGDTSFRVIRTEVEVTTLRQNHRSASFDRKGLLADPNVAIPLDRLKAMARSGRIGSLNHRALSLMGSITAPGRLKRDTLPQMSRLFEMDGVDVAVLVPV